MPRYTCVYCIRAAHTRCSTRHTHGSAASVTTVAEPSRAELCREEYKGNKYSTTLYFLLLLLLRVDGIVCTNSVYYTALHRFAVDRIMLWGKYHSKT